jgi:hypothetical protein
MRAKRATEDSIRITGAFAALLPEYEGDFRAAVQACDEGRVPQRRPTFSAIEVCIN